MPLNQINPIQTTNKSIRVEGKVFYNDRRRRIDVKKPIRDLFENGSEIGYIMEFCLSRDKLDARIDELAKKGITPVIMYFVNGGKDEA